MYAIHRTPDGIMWVGTEQEGGVSRYDGKEFINFTTKDGLVSYRVLTMWQDLDGIMWFGTRDGVSRYDGKTFVNFTTEDGLADNFVRTIYQDSDGAMWFGTRGGGVSRYDGKGFVNFTTKDGLASNVVETIRQDPDGVLWFGTSDGVSRYDGKAFVNYTTDDDLAVVGPIRAIYHGSYGSMWVGTDSAGVFRHDGIAWASLDTRDGLVGNRVNWIYQDENGFFWFITHNGVTRYRPNTTPPKVRILSVMTDRIYTNLVAIPSITTGQRVTITCQALDFQTIPEKQQYRYRIKGLDTDWGKPTKESTFDIIFSDVGDYTFEVQAIDRDLNYAQPASLTLKVIPDARDQQITKLESDLEKRNRELEAELRNAHDVQMSLMPESVPESDFFEIFGKCVPARLVSGDFFNYLDGKASNEVGIVVADAMGKAMKAAMNAVLTDGVIHSKAEELDALSPALLLTKANDILVKRLEEIMNITMVIGLINTELGTLTLANAGHHAYPLLLRNGRASSLIAKGMPLGMLAGIPYREVEFSLESGDVIMFMTDGIIEAEDADGNLYSASGRLEQTVAGLTKNLPATEMVEAVINDVIAYSEGKAHEKDDMTVVVLKVK